MAFYSRRWRIEEWHRILKSGCQVEEHQHQTGERLKRAIALDVVLAWRIQLLVLLGRQVPELPCDIFFDQWEVKILEALQQPKTPRQGGRGKKGDTGGQGDKGGKGKPPLPLGRRLRWSPNWEAISPEVPILLLEQNVSGKE